MYTTLFAIRIRSPGSAMTRLMKSRLASVFGVVPTSQLARDSHHLHGDELESALLKPRYDPADQTALHAVGFDQH